MRRKSEIIYKEKFRKQMRSNETVKNSVHEKGTQQNYCENMIKRSKNKSITIWNITNRKLGKSKKNIRMLDDSGTVSNELTR